MDIGEDEDRFQRTVPRPTGPREPPPPPTEPRESYSPVRDILNTYHFRDSFYERYIPRSIGSNLEFTPQNRDNGVPPVSQFDWTSSKSDDSRGRMFVREQKRAWKKRLGQFKEELKCQKTKIARAITSAVIFKKIRRWRSK